jgi:glycosyltransferase involved in cell wall biosynthesis
MLSVVVPVFNRAQLLPRTLASLLAQTRPADEILVVDDGSTDGSAAVAESFGSPVRVIRQANQGPAVARNRGLAEAQGEWVHFFDSDDLALPNLHAEQLRVLDQTGADVAYAPWLKCEISAHSIVPTNQVLQQHGLPQGDLVRALLTNWSVVPICCLMRTRLARQVGGFPVELHGTEDQLFFLRLLLAGARVVHSPNTLVVYRADNPGKLSAGGDGKHLRQWARFLLMAQEACLAHGVDPSRWFDFRLRVWDARVSLASQAGPADQSLIEALHQLEQGPWPGILYPLRRSIRRKGGGISSSLLGRRAHRSFRAGALTSSQLAQLQQFIVPA